MSNTNDTKDKSAMGGGMDGGMGGGMGGMGGGLLGALLSGVQVYTTDFTALNNSGVHAHGLLFPDKEAQTLTVNIRAEGMEPGQVHPQHIHGFTVVGDDPDAKSPTIAQDDDGDGFVELAEGEDTYGPIQLNLTLNPQNSVHDHGTEGHDHTGEAMFPTADENGVLRYTETFRFDRDDPNAQAIFDDITPLEAKEIVLHGLSTTEMQGEGTEGEVNGEAGYKAVLPVASGELQEVGFGGLLSALFHSQLGHAADSQLFGA